MKSDASITWRKATPADCPMLAELNLQLIRDEGHRNPMNVAQLEGRMRGWLESGEYTAVIFQRGGEVVAHGVYRESPEEIHLRQFFVVRAHRREGIGRQAVAILRREVWPATKRLTVEVLCKNTAGVAFWRAAGYDDYGLCLEVMPPR